MRMRKKPWAEEELTRNGLVVKGADAHKGHWNTVFNNGYPVHIEIGMGKGHFIIGKAALFPEVNFIGIDRQLSVFAVAARNIMEHVDTDNVRLVFADAGDIIEIFDENEVERIYINFCDPWLKRRYEKRRLTHSRFLEKYEKILPKGGKVVLKTDNKELYNFSLYEFTRNNWQIESTELNTIEGDITTEYEARFRALGMPIYGIIASPR